LDELPSPKRRKKWLISHVRGSVSCRSVSRADNYVGAEGRHPRRSGSNQRSLMTFHRLATDRPVPTNAMVGGANLGLPRLGGLVILLAPPAIVH